MKVLGAKKTELEPENLATRPLIPEISALTAKLSTESRVVSMLCRRPEGPALNSHVREGVD
jgi:hypothetical protein